MLLATEGTVTVSTDHTSGSSLDSQNAELQGFATPNYGAAMDKAQAAVDQYAYISSFTPPPMPEMLESSEATSGAVAGSDSQPRDGHSTGSAIAADEDAIEFRVIRSGAPVRRLRLTGNRYTFGSAEGCSIRLSDSALRPMHAVLIRDASRVLVRAYSVPIEINGVRTTEAKLRIGDVLRLGAYQFELLSLGQQKSVAPLDSSFPSDPFASTSFLAGLGPIFDSPAGTLDSSRSNEPQPSMQEPVRSESQPSSAFPEAIRKLPQTEEVIWRERLRREVEQWRERQIECDRRENRCDERESDLRNRETELWSRAENLYRREARIQSQEASTFQLYDDFTQRQHELIKLREEVQSRQEDFNRREAEFCGQETEYRRRLDEATRQLQQSHQQAETATQAVKRMREQFESLNSQIEELSSQQQQIESREQQQREEHECLRSELEFARDEAIDAQAESEARRCDAEARVAEMAAQIESLTRGQGKDLLEQQAQLEESERVAKQLREQVAELQKSVAEASEESSRLHKDYEEACESVRQLESLVAQSNERGDRDRESWMAEADELRSAVDQLSLELTRANGELSDLREANAEMSARLEDVQRERDDAHEDAQSRPTNEEFQTLKKELDAANDQLSQMKCEYDQTMARLSEVEAARDREPEPVCSSAAEQAESPAVDAHLKANEADQQIDQPENRQTEQDAKPVWLTKAPTNVEQSEGDEQIPAVADTPEPAGDLSEPSWPSHEPRSQMPQHTAASEGVSDPDTGGELTSNVDSDATDSPWPVAAPDPAISESTDPTATKLETSDQVDGAASGTAATEKDSDAGVWGESLSDEAEQDQQKPLSWSSRASSAGDVSPAEPAPVCDVEAGSEWPEAETQSDSGLNQHPEPSLEPQWNSQHDVGGEGDPPEMTSVWDGVGQELDALPKDQPNGSDIWSADRDNGDADNSSADNRSIVDGSLASMLIKDLDNERVDDAPPTDGTYLMSDAPTSFSWGQHGQDSGQDREHREESEESEWSNGPGGCRAEHVDEFAAEKSIEEAHASLDDAYDQAQADTEGDFSTDYDPSASYADPQSQTEPESFDSESDSDEELDDDDSIEAYMNRLLNRNQAETDTSSSEPETIYLSSSGLSKSVLLSQQADAEDATSINPDEPLVPRSKAPETNLGLDAMRELANASARSAITRSVRMQTRDTQVKGAISFACAGGASVCGIACCLFLPGMIRYLAVSMTAVVAMIYIMQGMQEFNEAKRRMRAAEMGLLEEEDAEGEEFEPAAEHELAETVE